MTNLSVLFVAVFFCNFLGCLSDKLVTTSLDAKWSHTSFIAETSEFIATEGNEYFWNYVDNCAKSDVHNISSWLIDSFETSSYEREYEFAIEKASAILSNARFGLLKFALSLRLFSPRIEVFQQIALEFSQPCTAFVDVNEAVTCDLNEIQSLLKESSSRERSLYSIDHVYGGNNRQAPVVVLYADIGSVEFGAFHATLKKLADDGQLQYVLRHFIKEQDSSTPVGLSGYGVELAIKNTEYKAIDDSNVGENEIDEEADSDVFGFDFNVLRKKNEHLKDALNQFKMHLFDTEELAPLKQWEVADLSFQAAQKVMDVDPEEALALLTDLSQNFPIRSRSLVQTKVKKAFRDEVALNQAVFSRDFDVSEGENAFFINGISIDVESLDIFQLFNTISKEESLANAFYGMGFRREYLSLIYKMDLSEDKTTYAIDYRDAFPEYINDLDKDKHYRDWGNSVKLLLQPYFPGMIRPIARNLFTMVCVIDPAAPEGRNLLKIAHSLFVHQVPLRIGFVFVVNGDSENFSGENDVGVALLNFYNFAKSDKTPAKAINLLTTLLDAFPAESLSVENIHAFFKKHFKDQDISDVFAKDSDYDNGRTAGQAFLKRSGLQTTPKVLLNGFVLDEASLQSDKIEDAILIQIMKQTVPLQKAVMMGRLTDKDNIQNWILNQPEVLPRVNNRLLKEPASYLHLHNVNPCKAKRIDEFVKLESEERSQCILENAKYLTKSDNEATRWLNVWLAGDFNSAKGRDMLRNGLKALKKSTHLRISVIQSAVSSNGHEHLSVARVILAILRLYPSNVAKQMLNKFLSTSEAEMKKKFTGESVVKSLIDEKFESIAVHGVSVDPLKKDLESDNFMELKIQQSFAQKELGLDREQFIIVSNGMVYGPLEPNEEFEVEDFLLLEKIFEKKGAKSVAAQVDEWAVSKESGKSSDVVMRALCVIGKYALKKKRQFVEFADDSESVVNILSIDGSRPVVEISAIIDPLSRNAQKLAPILQVLSNVVNSDLRLAMNPKGRLSELPLKRFYRYALSDQPMFNNQGRVLTPLVTFRELPTKQLFTMNVIAPDSWMVQPIHAEYDLDNIKMKTSKTNVIAKFQLVHILLEGHCFDEVSGNPPRGLQFVLGTKSNPNRYDTIVMANLGYFQLKASPGAWILKLREGKSKDIYEVKSSVDAESQTGEEVAVLIDSFLGKTVRLRVAKRVGMEKHNLLSDSSTGDSQHEMFTGEEEEGNSLWSSISNKLTGGEKYEKINIFSLASGHLYERFLRIMMLSVIKNTKHPVKFWLLNNYLSPQFRESIPKMAQKYGFEYELIEYKWPRWLHQQTEKIRVMWGYKILFLDVLFPLDVKKIIFVDADQVVRADMMELMNLDLGGAPYGYTPFCESRTTMDGFRFWKQGYWANHLSGRKYHISALYVVDLAKFRQIAAGDRLRGQYQGLSSDPNSLSNLDQDLPNNMIHQVRIKSLPQEWLWCETWCSDESKQTAKTIDLCNNPQTKEPKLDSAMRIIPEWNVYDSEIKQLLETSPANQTDDDDKLRKEADNTDHGDEL